MDFSSIDIPDSFPQDKDLFLKNSLVDILLDLDFELFSHKLSSVRDYPSILYFADSKDSDDHLVGASVLVENKFYQLLAI